ncbi:DUF1552 domain-containing protein [Pyxidicoccus fallax]|uniref:DUF1552 domain-containing protein n=1 Tax=Pyxidicoccus fallax TaxID=394095 RepID=A0A848LY78_9BACT|nr:DUF1552 domain-containing protein [Pyxidicoccus fallax]NMO22579.1 DUF1552 domain-containing protein [Pyxidicoccus fallax]NPC84669.1 DUF1552 domain-containing protein [Pyxidicoccus fallax]
MSPSEARAQAAGSKPPLRFVGIFHSAGVVPNQWFPTTEGANYALPASLSPLEPVKGDVLVLSGLRLGSWDYYERTHEGGFWMMLTASEKIVAGSTDSIDQVIANATASQVRVPSLTLSVENNGYYDPGYRDSNGDGFIDPKTSSYDDTQDHCTGADHCMATFARGQRLPNVYNPRVIFNRLFGSLTQEGPTEQERRIWNYRRSVLDRVTSQAKALQGRLGRADQLRLDEYMSGIRTIEQAIQRAEQGTPVPACTPGAQPVGIPMDRTAYANLMCDLIVKAFECDATRVATLMLGMCVSPMTFSVNGRTFSHHGDASHHGNDPVKLAAKVEIDKWQVSRLTHLVQRLKAVREGTGSLLDNTAVFYSSDISHSDWHNHYDMPVILAGGAGGAFRPGRHLRAKDKRCGDVLLSILQAFGIPRGNFGPLAQAPLSGLA